MSATTKTRVWTITCPVCKVEMYSRARHDYRSCKCGTMVDGGFDYMRFGWPNGAVRPVPKMRYVQATRYELFQDWNQRINAFGIIKVS